MKPALLRIGPKVRVALALTTMLAAAVALFDWNWMRHPMEQYLQHRSQREVRIGHLDVDLGFPLEPTVHLRDVYVQNAPWASDRPAAVVVAASFTFSLRSVWEGRPAISRLVLRDAEVSLERQADGLRNWRLRNPGDRGPGRVKVLRLEPRGVTLRLVRHDIGLDVTATTRPAAVAVRELERDAVHPLTIAFQGSYGTAAFSGAAVTSDAITLIDTGIAFPIRARMTTGKTRLDFDGSVADFYRPSAIDGDLRLAGPTLAGIGPFFRTTLPASRPFELRCLFRLGTGTTSFAKLHGRIGSTGLEGNVGIDPTQGRPRVDAVLRSPLADLSDFGFLADDTSAGLVRQERGENRRPALDAGRLGSVDGNLRVAFDKIRSRILPELESLRFTADLRDRVVVLQPLDLGVAGGHVTGRVRIDLRRPATAVRVRASIDQVRIEQLLWRLAIGSQVSGPLDGHLDLSSHGRSADAWLDHLSGTADIAMQGGTISNRLDAKLGLNGGKLLGLMFTGDRAIAINAAAVSVEFEQGIGRSSRLEFDSAQTHVQAAGVVDLRAQTVDLVLRPHPKNRTILALRSAIRLHGPLRGPRVSLAPRAARDRQQLDPIQGGEGAPLRQPQRGA